MLHSFSEGLHASSSALASGCTLAHTEPYLHTSVASSPHRRKEPARSKHRSLALYILCGVLGILAGPAGERQAQDGFSAHAATGWPWLMASLSPWLSLQPFVPSVETQGHTTVEAEFFVDVA